ncbi:type IV secretion system protein [Bartonella rattimassiliensis]|uniref:type IV secretion system protein n=1 Tax=Bartonella rattimassiliensis TaxID=270250 RepID=UPI001FD50DDC|nr:type IV secretion system protein [Bartonella rattimassiliensis]
MLMTKIVLILLVGIGPLFIIALLWQPTHRFLEQRISQILSYTTFLMLLATIFTLMMQNLYKLQIFANYTTDLEFDDEQNIGCALGNALTLSIIPIVLIFNCPALPIL